MKQLSLILVLLLMAGCSWIGGGSDEESAIDADEVADLQDYTEMVELEELWSTGTGNGQELHIASLRPALGSGKVYVADDEGLVVAVDRDSGDKVWSAELDDRLSGGVGVGGSMVLVGSHDGILYALSEDDGTLLWQSQLTGEILSAPDSDGHIVAVQTLDGKLFGLDADSGERLWFYESEVPILTLYGTSSPLIVKGVIYAGFADGKLLAIEAETGGVVWEERLTLPRGQTELERLSDIDGQLLLDGEVLYVSGYRGSVAAMSRATGRTLWTQESSSFHGPAVTGNRLVIVDADDAVVAMRSSGGQRLWKNDMFYNRNLSQPVALGEHVVVGDGEGYLHVLSASDGEIIGRTRVDSSGIYAPIATDGYTLYVLDSDGGLTAYIIN